MAILCPLVFALANTMTWVVNMKLWYPPTDFKLASNVTSGIVLIIMMIFMVPKYNFEFGMYFRTFLAGLSTMLAGLAISKAMTLGYAGVVGALSAT